MMPGQYFARTIRWVAIIRRRRESGYTMQAIAEELGIKKQRVWQLCERHGIGGRQHRRCKDRKKHRVLVPLAPQEAERITDSKRRYWREQGVA